MPTNWQTYPLNFQGGLITNLGLLEHGSQFPGSARRLINFECSLGGGYSKVLGYEPWVADPVPGSTSTPISASILLDANRVLAIRGTTAYVATRSDMAGWVANGTALANAPAHRVRHASYDFGQGVQIVMVDGANAPYYYDVATNVLTQPTPGVGGDDIEGSSFVAVFADRLFFAKGPLITYSNLLTSGSFDPALGAGVFKVEGDVTGLVVFRDQLIIFGEDRIDVLTGTV